VTVGSPHLPRRDIGRTIALAKAFRRERSHPEELYTLMAEDAVRSVGSYRPVDGTDWVDVGSGPSYVADAVERRGGRCINVDRDAAEFELHGRHARLAVVGDACVLPIRSECVDIVHCSNVVEHVPDAVPLFDELVRVTKREGIVYLSFTNWLSPWGGHETSPWHYLGGERALRRYERRHGPAKNRYGESLFRLHLGPVLRGLAQRDDVRVLSVAPRYYPGWTRWIVRVPGVREVATWNAEVILQRR
jgi:SAM-dependent methyltransferase